MDFQNKIMWMQDILPDLNRYHTFFKKVFRHELRKNGFRRITTPILEYKSLFSNALWEQDEIITEQLYSFVDKKWRDLALRPESTASIMRAYLENNLTEDPQPVFLYYMEPHFRYDIPKDGVYRQFFQAWAEIIWELDPILDAQLIYIWYIFLNKIWLENKFKVKINSLWNLKDRQKYIDELVWFYDNKKHLLSEKSVKLLDTSPLKLLWSKEPDEIILANEAPKMSKFLKKDSLEHYKKVKEYLEILKVPYEEDHKVVMNIDYYNHTVWEFVEQKEDSEISLWTGWRYDGLSKKLWHNTEVPGVWFAFNMDKIIESMLEKEIKIKNKDRIDLYFIQLWEDAKKIVLPLTLEARARWINTLSSLWTPSLKVQMKKATRINATFVVMVWLMEVHSWIYQVRNMIDWTQEEVKKENLIDYIIEKIWNDHLNFYCPANDLIDKN